MREYKMQYYIEVPDLFSIMNASFGFLSIIMNNNDIRGWHGGCLSVNVTGSYF